MFTNIPLTILEKIHSWDDVGVAKKKMKIKSLSWKYRYVLLFMVCKKVVCKKGKQLMSWAICKFNYTSLLK